MNWGRGDPGGRGGPALGDTPPTAQPCRAVPRVHAFGKGGQALRRDPRAPPVLRGWLHKQVGRGGLGGGSYGVWGGAGGDSAGGG